MTGTSQDDPSGNATAQAAHEAGAVALPEPLPNMDVSLHFVVRGGRERAERLAEQLALSLLARVDVAMPVDYSVRDRDER